MLAKTPRVALLMGLIVIATASASANASGQDHRRVFGTLFGVAHHFVIGDEFRSEAFSAAVDNIKNEVIHREGRTEELAQLVGDDLPDGLVGLLMEASSHYVGDDGVFRSADFNAALANVTRARVQQTARDRKLANSRAFVEVMKTMAGEEELSPSKRLFRIWTDRTGRKLDAEYIGFNGGKVEIKRTSDGKTFYVPLERLSDADQAFVRSQAAGKPEKSRNAQTPASSDHRKAKERFLPEAIPAHEAEEMQRLGTTWAFAVSVFNRDTDEFDIIPKETTAELEAFFRRLDLGKESERARFVSEVVRLLGEKRARWGIVISDSRGRPAFRWPGRTAK